MSGDAPVADPSPAPEPEGEKMYPEKVVKDLRGEAARYRTERNQFRDAFEGFEEAERDVFLDMVSNLRTNPEQALEQFQGVTDRLAKQLGKETPAVDPNPTTPPEPTPAPEPPTPAVSAEDIKAMVAEGVNQVLQARDTEAAQKAEVDATLAEAEGLGFTTPAQKAQLFAKAQELGVGLEEAAGSITGEFQSAVDAAVTEALKAAGINPEASGSNHPTPTPNGGGDSINPQDQGEAKTLDDARDAAEAYFRERFGR